MGNQTKKQRLSRMKRDGLHEIRNKKRPRAVEKKRKGLVLTPKKRHRLLKFCSATAAVLIFGIGILVATGSLNPILSLIFGWSAAPQVVADDFSTVYSTPVKGKTPLDYAASYERAAEGEPDKNAAALQNVAFLNYTFWNQTQWYAEVHGTTTTPVGPQAVNTFKQYSNGKLIMADVTSSSLVKAARQFCYVEKRVNVGEGLKERDEGEVMWRTGSSYTGASYEDMLTIRWKNDLYAHMATQEFKKVNGLPGTEFTVYIINEQTLVSAEAVKDNGDGTYSQTYVLDPALDKAPAHYANQMKFTGGLTALPTFNYINVTYTFDEHWRVLSADVSESYKATMGITVTCTSEFHTDYEYATERCTSTVYDTFFKPFVGKDLTDAPPVQLDAMGCLSAAFLTNSVTFDLNADLNGKKVQGALNLDASKLDIASLMSGGSVDIGAALNDISLNAEVGSVKICFADGKAYLSVGSVKGAVDLGQIVKLFGGTQGKKTAAEGTEETEETPLFCIDDPATEEPDDGFTFKAGEWARIKAQLNLKSVGIDFVLPMEFEFTLNSENNASLKEAKIDVAYGDISAALLLSSSTRELNAPTAEEKKDYIDLTDHIQTAAKILGGDVFTVELDYTSGGLSLKGALGVSLSTANVSGKLHVVYGSIDKDVDLFYRDGRAYISVEGFKASVGINDVASLIGALTGAGGEATTAGGLLDTVLSLDVEKLIRLQEDADGGNRLKAVIDLTAILADFTDFNVGEVKLEVGGGEIKAEALGASVVVKEGGQVSAPQEGDTDGYWNIAPVLHVIPEVLAERKLSFAGNVKVSVKGTDISLKINNGVLCFEDGIQVFLDATLTVKDSVADVKLCYDGDKINVRVGEFSLSLDFNEIKDIGKEVEALYDRIRGTVNPVLEDKTLPETLSAVLGLLGGFTDVGEGTGADFGLEGSDKENGVVSIALFGVQIHLIDETGTGKLLALTVEFNNDSVAVDGKLDVDVYNGTLPVFEAANTHFGKDEIIELIDYVGAIFGTLNEDRLSVTLNGTIASDEEKYAQYGGVKSEIAGGVELYTGEKTFLTLNIENKKIVVSTDVYLRVDFKLTPSAEDEKAIDVQAFVLDYNYNSGEKDGVLDFYFAISYSSAAAEKSPLYIYASADEFMPLVASLVSMLGVDNTLVQDFLCAPWFSAQTAGELKGFGNAIKGMLAGLLKPSDKTENTQQSRSTSVAGDIIDSVHIGSDAFKLEIPASVFGASGDSFKVEIRKEQGENGSRLTAVMLTDLYVSGNRVSLDINASYEGEEELPLPQFGKTFELNGVAALLKMLSHSTTHEATQSEIISGEAKEHEYLLNKYFFINGEININLNALSIVKADIKINVEAISVTFDENGDVGVNVRFSYEHLKKLSITVINGDTTVDLTGKNDMVYIKRVQTTDADGKKLPKEEVFYRAMPLKNFLDDIINQAAFTFNLGSTIVDALAGIDSGESDNTGEIVENDIGTTFWNLFKSFTYTPGERDEDGFKTTGDVYDMVLNGAGLNEMLGDIHVKLTTDKEDQLRAIQADLTLNASGIAEITLNLELNYRNPCGVMDAGVRDNSVDIAAQLTSGMDYKLSIVNWDEAKFIEGQFVTLEYILSGEVISSQDIVLSTGVDGTAEKGTPYGNLVYPDLTAYDNEAGYHVDWEKRYEAGEAIPDSRQIFAKYFACTYTVTVDFGDGYGYESETLSYTYDDGAFALPFKENERFRIVCFKDGEGNEYRTAEDMKRVTADTTLTAVWEDVIYTVTFDFGNGTVQAVQGRYGDALVMPEAVRTGYTTDGWKYSGNSFTENVTVTADWTPVTVTVTLVSEYAADGFEETDNGYTKTVEVVYGEAAKELPTYNDKTLGLSLVSYVDDAGNPYYRVENLLSDLTLTAVWEEIDCIVTFRNIDGEEIKTVNVKKGTDLTTAAGIPPVPEKIGYTGAWDIQGPITDDTDVSPKYTANTYTVTAVSRYAVNGFAADGDEYVKRYSYTYDGQAVTFENLSDIHGYWFKGYYTQADGAGEQLTDVDLITSDMRVYVYWQDNTVKVRLYSDLNFEGASKDNSKNAFYKEFVFNDTYTWDYLPKVQGYQALAVWHEENDSYARVTDVRNLDGENLWVLWIKEIKVTITDAHTNGLLGGIQYNIGGTVKGGTAFGQKSAEIYGANKVSRDSRATFYIRGANKSDDIDNPGGNKTITVSYDSEGVGTFESGAMNSNTYRGSTWGGKEAYYGGVVLKMTFSYGEMSIELSDGAIVSIATYTVTYVDEDGNVLKTESGLRRDCPFDDYNCKIYTDDFAPEAPQKEHNAVYWPHEEIVNSVTVAPVYVPEQFSVTLVSVDRVEGWEQNGDGKYIYTLKMDFGADIVFYYMNDVLARYSVEAKDNVICVPALESDQKWSNRSIKSNGIKWNAQHNVDMVTYNSDGVSYFYRETQYDCYSEEVTSGYTLITPTAIGYTFLGWWYKEDNGNWTKVTEIQPTEGEEKKAITLQALWMSELSITKLEKTSETSSGGFIGVGKTYTYGFSSEISGGRLVGAFADEEKVTIEMKYGYCCNKNSAEPSTADTTNTYYTYTSKDSVYVTCSSTGAKSHGHLMVTVAYAYGDKTFTARYHTYTNL